MASDNEINKNNICFVLKIKKNIIIPDLGDVIPCNFSGGCKLFCNFPQCEIC